MNEPPKRNEGGALARVLAQPLAQFLMLGAAVFVLVTWQSGGSQEGDEDDGSAQTIEVTRDDLLAYVQMRTQSADAAGTAREFDALDDGGRQAWIDRFVREEALVREARRLGLDRDDDLIRRRLVQQMEFLAEDLAARSDPITRAELEAAYPNRAEQYREPAVVTFTHVFVRVDGAANDGEVESARQRAAGIAATATASATDPASLGDRFLYHRRYVERTLDEVDSHFGGEVASRLEQLEVDGARFQGPLRSDHGWHVVKLTARVDSRVPSFREVEAELRRDLRRRRSDDRVEAGLSKIVDGYAVDLGADLQP